MEELTVDNVSRSTISSDNEYNLSPAISSDGQEYTKDVDNRIACSNNRSLNSIAQTVSAHITQFANFLDLGEVPLYTSRVLEIFKDNIQENVTVNNMPYTGDKNFDTPADSEVLINETKEALLSNLSKKVQNVCAKRKRCPKEYVRIHKMRLHHEYQNVKKAIVKHEVKIPSVSQNSFQLDSLPSQKVFETGLKLKSTQSRLLDAVHELKETKKNIDYAQSVVSKQQCLCDTGYISS